jgi:hypothetical protein
MFIDGRAQGDFSIPIDSEHRYVWTDVHLFNIYYMIAGNKPALFGSTLNARVDGVLNQRADLFMAKTLICHI